MSNENYPLNQSSLTRLTPMFTLGIPMAADPVSDYGSSSGLTNLTTGDVDNDGYPDIAAAHGYRKAGLYLHNGDQSFAAEQIISEKWWPVAQNIGATSIALGDLDLDGNLDMVVPLYGNHYSGHMIQLYKGNGDGSFALWPVDGYNANTNSQGANQDGIDDGIILSKGAVNPMFPGIADINNDGLPDVLVSGNNGSWSVDVLAQSADQEFSVSDSDGAGQNPQYFDLADFNEDGYPDVAVGALYNGVLVFLNDADGKGTLHQEGGTYLSPNHQFVVAADFNGDGHEDIAVHGNKDAQVDILYGDGTGQFPSTANFPVSGKDGYLAAADFDNDDDSDLVVVSTSSKSVDLLLNDGDGQFGAPESTVLDAAPWGIAADDFDQDGFMDVAVARDDNTVQILWNCGVVSVSAASFSLAENSALGTNAGTVTAAGPAPLTYAITTGNSDPDGDGNPAFAIDPATGQISVNDSGDLNFEVTAQFNILAKVTDADGFSDEAPILVQLTNADEPGNDRPEAQDNSFTLPELSVDGCAVGTVAATDVDAGDTLTYAITAGNSDPDDDGQATFAIDPATGAISINDSGDLDFETTPEFSLTVKATDTGGLSAAATVAITLANVFEREGTPVDDRLAGTSGNDALSGLGGEDKLSGGLGDDNLDGGTGTDTLREQADEDFTLTDSQLTGLGDDSLANIERAILTGGVGDNRLDASGFDRGPVRLEGGAGDDTLISPENAGSFHLFGFYYNTLTGGDGNDTLTGGAGVDCVKETGNVDFTLIDSQLTGRGNDHLNSMELAHLVGGQGNNRLDASGFTGSQTMLEGGAGNDTLIGGAAVDWVWANGNTDFTLNDTQLVGLGSDALQAMDKAYLCGGDGDNHFDASGFTGDLTILKGQGGNNTLTGREGGSDRVYARGDVDFTLTDSQLTGLGTDTLASIEQASLVGGAGNNRLDASGFTGDFVSLEGGDGDDTLIGRAVGIDLVRAHGNVDFKLTDSQLIGRGADSLADIDQAALVGDGDANILDASAFSHGRVFLYGESGNDTLKGGAGDDILNGGVGDDRLIGGEGVDRVEGRADADLTLSATQLLGLGSDTLDSIEQGYLCGGPRNNVLDASTFTGSLVILEGQGGNDTLIGREVGVDRVRAQADVDFTLTDTQLTGLGADTLTDIDEAQLVGNSGDNVFDASAFTRGTVRLSGGGGDDSLFGGNGGDRLDGGQGNDSLVGGLGRDSLSGGLGADVFKFASVAETGLTYALRDIIKDFDFSQGDKIDLSAIDADTAVDGDQAFGGVTEGGTFSGVFANPGDLYFDQTKHILYGNNDADGEANFSIQLTGVSSLGVEAFVL